MTHPLIPDDPLTLTHNGITDTVRGWADRLGISIRGMYNRVYELPETEWFKKPDKRPIMVECPDGKMRPLTIVARQYGINKQTAHYRYNQGASFAQLVHGGKK